MQLDVIKNLHDIITSINSIEEFVSVIKKHLPELKGQVSDLMK